MLLITEKMADSVSPNAGQAFFAAGNKMKSMFAIAFVFGRLPVFFRKTETSRFCIFNARFDDPDN